eukprot:s622_g10.t2
MAPSSEEDATPLPWHYDLATADQLPVGKRLLRVCDIAFTQRQVNDSFSHERRDVMELIEGVLHDGQFWAIDNRRLFVYKHCKVERVLVEVIRWEDQHEFEMKWKNGLHSRGPGRGHTAGVVQRLMHRPFPRSPVMNEEQSEISWFMDDDAQYHHDNLRAENQYRYWAAARNEDSLARNLLLQNKYKTAAVAGQGVGRPTWLVCTLLRAKVDGTFEALVDNGAGGFLHPGLHASEIEENDEPSPVKLELDESLFKTFLVPHDMKSKLAKPWCAICAKLVTNLKQHDKSHRGCFQCSCGKAFEGSQPLRSHARRKQHLIPYMFRPPEELEHLHVSSSESDNDDGTTDTTAAAASRAGRATRKRVVEEPDPAETFVVVKGESSRVPRGSRCVLCEETVEVMRDHDRRCHVGAFQCSSCGKVCSCSEDLRRHSRSTGHRIHRRFQLGWDRWAHWDRWDDGGDEDRDDDSSGSGSSSSDVEGLEDQVRPKRSFAEWQAAILGDEEDDADAAPNLSRSAGPPSEHIQRVLKHGMDGRDLQELTDAELHAVAEQEQLASELAAMNASGRLALAYVFVKKMGSLTRAFRWFDTRRIGKIAQVVWDTGFTLLHIDSEKLTGWKPFEIFKQIDIDPCDGLISMKDWKNYFKEAAETIAAEMEEKGTTDFSQQVKLRGHAMKNSAAKNRRNRKSAYDQDPWLLQMKEKQAITKQEEDFRRRVTDKLMALQETESFTFGREWLCDVDGKLSPVRRSVIVEEVAEKLRLFSLPSPALVDLKSLHRSISMTLDSKEESEMDYSLLPYLTISQEEGGRTPSGTDPGSILVMNLTEYAQEIEDQLESIPLHGSMSFSTALVETQRAVIQLLAKRLGLVAVMEPRGANQELVVYNVAPDFVQNIEIQLNGLRQNEGCMFNEDLSEEERKLARVLSENLGFLTTRNSDGSLSAFNLQDFASELREQLTSLAIGEEVRMPIGTKTEEQQLMVFRLIQELGLEVREEGTKKTREVIISNLVQYLSMAKERMIAAEDGEVLEFILPPQEKQQEAFFDLAKDYAFECVNRVNTNDGVEAHLVRMAVEKTSVAQRRRRSSIVKQASKTDLEEVVPIIKPPTPDPDDAEVESSSSEGLEDSSQATSLSFEELPEPIQRNSGDGLVARVFQQYASGRWIGQALFLRYGDLKGFAEDLKYVTPNVDTKLYRFTGMFEYVFEDTLQLQIDMGVRVRHGLTLEWFQIFLQKIILRLGMEFVPVLFRLLEDADWTA